MPVFHRESVFNKRNLISSFLLLVITFIIPVTATKLYNNYSTQVSANSTGFISNSVSVIHNQIFDVYGPFIILIPLALIILWVALVITYKKIK